MILRLSVVSSGSRDVNWYAGRPANRVVHAGVEVPQVMLSVYRESVIGLEGENATRA